MISKVLQKTRKSEILLRLRGNSFIIICLAPVIIFFLIFDYGPTLYSFYLSLFKTKMLTPVNFIGFQNYLNVLKDSSFWGALWNTFFFTAGTVIGSIVFGLILALLLESKTPGNTFFRSIFFMPYIIPYAAFTLLWYWILDPVYGLINYSLSFIGIKAIPWYTSSDWVIPSFILMNIWKRMGFAMTLFITGLHTIPEELYDAAIVDGANWWAKFRYITLPLLRPITLFATVVSAIYCLQLFIEPFVITKGGPSNASTSIVFLLYKTAFYLYNVGQASAIAVIFFIIVALFTFILMKRFKVENF